jgi:viologen exporter family transport system permease protein
VHIREGFEMWWRLVGARVRGQLQYRTSFALNTFAAFVLTFVDFVVVLALFGHFPALGGWTLQQVALLYGISGIGIAVADLLIGHIDMIHLDIRSGQFDVVLLRPVGTLLQVMSSDLALRRIGRIVQAAFVLVYALVAADIEWNVLRVALLPAGIVCGAVIFGATFVLGGCLTFWTVGSGEIANTFTYGGNTMTSYPLNIFGPWLRRLLAFAVPLAFVTYFPGLYLLDKPDPLGFPTAFQFLAPVVAIGFAALTGAAWRTSVRHYRSTGS